MNILSLPDAVIYLILSFYFQKPDDIIKLISINKKMNIYWSELYGSIRTVTAEYFLKDMPVDHPEIRLSYKKLTRYEMKRDFYFYLKDSCFTKGVCEKMLAMQIGKDKDLEVLKRELLKRKIIKEPKLITEDMDQNTRLEAELFNERLDSCKVFLFKINEYEYWNQLKSGKGGEIGQFLENKFDSWAIYKNLSLYYWPILDFRIPVTRGQSIKFSKSGSYKLIRDWNDYILWRFQCIYPYTIENLKVISLMIEAGENQFDLVKNEIYFKVFARLLMRFFVLTVINYSFFIGWTLFFVILIRGDTPLLDFSIYIVVISSVLQMFSTAVALLVSETMLLIYELLKFVVIKIVQAIHKWYILICQLIRFVFEMKYSNQEKSIVIIEDDLEDDIENNYYNANSDRFVTIPLLRRSR